MGEREPDTIRELEEEGFVCLGKSKDNKYKVFYTEDKYVLYETKTDKIVGRFKIKG